MGYALYETALREREPFSWRTLLLLVMLANLPDIDFLPGLLAGNPNQYHHHYFSHSLPFALVVGAVLAGHVSIKKGKKFWPYFLLFAGVCFSHVILDYFSADTSEPLGVPMFWPLSNEYYYSPVLIFMSVNKSSSSATFFQSLLVMHNLWVALWEVVVFVPVLTIIKMVKMRKRALNMSLRATEGSEAISDI